MNLLTKLYVYMYYLCSYATVHNFTIIIRAGGIGPAAPVLAGPVFSQGKSKIPFLQKANNKQSASGNLGLIRFVILSR